MEPFTAEERAALAPHFTNLDGPVFALVNLPEVVKGALFARYSRSAEVAPPAVPRRVPGPRSGAPRPSADARVGTARAEALYERVFNEYGDDSVAQLGGVHLACEGASNLLTKVLEWGRLMAYLEQSTRYVPYTDRPAAPGGITCPPSSRPSAGRALRRSLDRAFETYARWLEPHAGVLGARVSRGRRRAATPRGA